MWQTTIHLFFSLPFWGLWFLLNIKDFYPFQMLYFCFIHIEIKFNDIGLVIKLQNSFESLKFGFYFIIFLICSICSLWSVKNYIFFHSYRKNDFSYITLKSTVFWILVLFLSRRWVRLLFGREFPLQDLLVVWDALFADGLSLSLVDYIFIAMLLYIRDACKC